MVVQSIRTIHGVTVTMSGGSTLCSVAGTTTTITFVGDNGDVPLLQVSNVVLTGTVMATPTAITTVTGNTENIPCSGRGLCNSGLGTCACFSGYVSSDGQGNAGPLPDCGAIDNSVPTNYCPGSTLCCGRGVVCWGARVWLVCYGSGVAEQADECRCVSVLVYPRVRLWMCLNCSVLNL